MEPTATGPWVGRLVHDGLILIVCVLLLVGLIVWLTRVLRPDAEVRRTGSQAASRAGEILDERFAQGDIDEDEYLKRQTLLPGE